MTKTQWHRLNPWDPCQMDLRGRWDRWFLATRCFRLDLFDPFCLKSPKPPEDPCRRLNLWDPFGLYYRFDLGVPLCQSRWDRWDRLSLFDRFGLEGQLLNRRQHRWDPWVQWGQRCLRDPSVLWNPESLVGLGASALAVQLRPWFRCPGPRSRTTFRGT